MSHLRYITVGCERIFRWFARVGRPERPGLLYPCAKAALLMPPLLGVPSAAFYPALAAVNAVPGVIAPGELGSSGQAWGGFPASNSLRSVSSREISPVLTAFSTTVTEEATTTQAFAYNIGVIPPEQTAIPEPPSVALLTVAVVGAGAARLVRRRRG